MALISIPRSNYFDKNILPELDIQAREWSCTRSDVIRALLCAYLRYPSPQRSIEQIEKIYTAEVDIERKSGQDKCIVVYLDSGFENVLSRYAMNCHISVDVATMHITCKYLQVFPEPIPEPKSPRFDSISLGPGKGHVTVKKVNTCKS